MSEHEQERWDEALRTLREEPLDECLSGEVRAAVLGRIRRERRIRWAWMAAAAAAVVVTVGLGIQRRGAEAPVVQPVERAEARLPAEPVVAVAPAARRPVRPPQATGLPHRTRKKAPPKQMAREPMKIHMLTDDPDLVIIWLAGEEGDLE